MMAQIPLKCYRSRHDRVLFGVCGGLAEYTGVDPVIVRLVFSITFFIFWIGFLAYFIAYFMMPQEPKQQEK
ncbi:MAG: PspC domain-containing protein [bacterium]|nr:PspC domain-containing protein [bacterium]